MIVEVYKNLHKNKWSVRDKKTRRVVTHADVIILADCTFKVSPAGNARVRREHKKYVHAFVVGDRSAYRKYGLLSDIKGLKPVKVFYNPYRDTTFVDEYGVPVYSADLVILGKGHVLAYNPKGA